ncbi:hypothetical protein K9K77_02610, partial [Candidatus Babeliales bacterium]|nr:hypothetical protein [Candidatus Babeliales bacterium]
VACKEGSFLAQEIGKIKKEKGEHEEAKKYFISALESFKTLSESHDQALKVTGVKGIATLFLEQNHPAIFDIRTLHQTNTDFCKEMSICPCQHALLILETEKQEQECANMCAQIYCGRYSTCSKITRDYDKALDVLKPFKDTLPDFVLPTIEGFKLLRSLDTSDQQKGYEIINAQYTINKNNLINYQSLEESRDTIIVPLCHEILKNTEICISIKPKPEIIKDLTTQTQSIIKLYKTNFSQELAEILFSINNNLIKSINKHHDIFPFNDILKYQTILAIGQSEITNYLINTSDRFDKKTESCYKQTKGYIDKFFAPTLLELNNQSISEKKAFEQIIELVSQGSVYWGENFNYLFKILPLIQKLQTETQTECPYFTEKKRVLERAYYLIKKEVPAEIERLKNTSLQEGDNQFSLYKQALTLQKSCDIIPGLEQYKEEISQECATLKKSLETFNRDVYAQTQKLKKTAQVLSQISHILKPHEISCYLPGASAPLEEDIFKKLQNTSTTTKPIYAALLNEIVKLHTNPTEANISLLVKNKKNLFDIYTLGIAHQRNKESINTIHGLCLAIPYLNAEEQGAAQARMHQLITTISHDLLREISTSSGDAQKVYKDVFQHLLITFHTEPDYKQTILKILKSEFNTSDFLK